MPTIIIQDVPAKVIKKVGTNIKYSKNIKFPSKKRPTNKTNFEITYWDDNEIENLWKTSTIKSKSF